MTIDVGAFSTALRVLDFAGFEGGNGARVLSTAITRVERAAELGTTDLRAVRASLTGTTTMLQRAVRDGIGRGVGTQSLVDAHDVAVDLLARLRAGTFDPATALALIR